MTPFTGQHAAALLQWFDAEEMLYPWSMGHPAAPTPWSCLVSEVMLQQTTVSAVLPRFDSWMKHFPTPAHLAAAGEEDVLREWEGLGYYSRARNLLAAAKLIKESHGGRVPENFLELKRLPGVGDYIAGAVASFAFNQPAAAIDTNVRRIAQRLSAARKWKREFETALRLSIETHMPRRQPGRLNAALMQLGQQVCLPRNPLCAECPLNTSCMARKTGNPGSYPARRQRKVIHKTTILALLCHGGRVLMQKRCEGIARGMWVFPPLSSLPLIHLWKVHMRLPVHVHHYTRYREELHPRVYRPLKKDSDGTLMEMTGAGGEASWFPMNSLSEKPMPTAYRRITDNLTSSGLA